MNLTDIKKALYREKPEALRSDIKDQVHYYTSELSNGFVVNFEVPESDMGTAEFGTSMDGKLLIRWVTNNTN